MEVSPADVASNPRDARIKGATITISPTDDQPPPRKEGEAVAKSWSRQVWDGAGFGGRAREDFDFGEDAVATPAADHHLP